MRIDRILIFILFCLFLPATMLTAVDWTSYSQAYDEGDIAIQVGIGLLPTGSTGTVTIPPISVSGEYAVRVADLPFSFGGFVGYMSSNLSTSTMGITYGYDYTYLMVGGRASYHVDFDVDKLDTYTGLMLGYNVITATYKGDAAFEAMAGTASASGLLVGGYVGARYFLTDNIALFGELGYGIGLITLGGTFKF